MDIFNSQKKYIKAYISNFEGAVELRTTLMNLDTVEGVREVLLQLVIKCYLIWNSGKYYNFVFCNLNIWYPTPFYHGWFKKGILLHVFLL